MKKQIPSPAAGKKIDHQALASWIFGAVLLIFFGYVFLSAPDSLPPYKHQILGLFASVMAGFFTFFLTGVLGLDVEINKFPGGTLTIRSMGGIAVAVLVMFWWQSPTAPVKTAPVIQSSSGNTTAPTVHSLFRSDFSNLLKFGKTYASTAANGNKINVEASLYEDFDGGNQFIGFFVPSCSSAFDLSSTLCKQVQATLDLNKSVWVGSKTQGEQQLLSNRDLKFSGRVYLYHEDFFSPRQIATLVDVYKSKNLDVQFRGPDYAISAVLRHPTAP